MSDENHHIGLNAHLLSLRASYRGAGISWYIINLLKNLAPISPDWLRYSVFLSDPTFAEAALRLHRSRWPTHRPPVRILWEQVIQPIALRQAGVDLLHALAFVAPIAAPCPFVVTVYDLSFLRYPEAFRPFNRWYLRHFTTRSVRRAGAVIAISESTRQDVIQLLGVAPERVHTVYCGVDEAFRQLPPAEVAAFKTARGLPEQFLLFLGTLEPRKNIEGLLRAYAHWRKEEPQAPPLIVAGGKGWHYNQIFGLVEQLNLTESVHFPGYIPQKELTLWYNSATIFIYPSYFEGFGLPVLEAMACGTPVITSNRSSLPEVAGSNGAACLVDPDDIPALAGAMDRLISRPDLRASMSQQGLERAAQFSWERTARQTVAIYRQLLAL